MTPITMKFNTSVKVIQYSLAIARRVKPPYHQLGPNGPRADISRFHTFRNCQTYQYLTAFIKA